MGRISVPRQVENGLCLEGLRKGWREGQPIFLRWAYSYFLRSEIFRKLGTWRGDDLVLLYFTFIKI